MNASERKTLANVAMQFDQLSQNLAKMVWLMNLGNHYNLHDSVILDQIQGHTDTLIDQRNRMWTELHKLDAEIERGLQNQ